MNMTTRMHPIRIFPDEWKMYERTETRREEDILGAAEMMMIFLPTTNEKLLRRI